MVIDDLPLLFLHPVLHDLLLSSEVIKTENLYAPDLRTRVLFLSYTVLVFSFVIHQPIYILTRRKIT